MDLNEVFSNPLFIPLLVAVITIISNAAFLYWLRKWQYKAEYIITNVQKTYIPILKEINDGIESLDRFLTNPSQLKWTFDTLEATKKSGLFEFIRSHDKQLYQTLTFFHDKICPKFGELIVLQEKTKQTIRADWTQHVKSVVSDTTARGYAGIFVNEVLSDHMFVELLNGRTERFTKVWNETINSLSHQYNLYGRLPSGKAASFFDASEDDVPKLIQLSQPKIKELHDYYNQTKNLVDKEVVKGAIPMMQKYITNPLARSSMNIQK